MYCMNYSISNFFSNHTISISVNDSNFIRFFFKQACNDNPAAEKNEQDQVYLFQYIYF